MKISIRKDVESFLLLLIEYDDERMKYTGCAMLLLTAFNWRNVFFLRCRFAYTIYRVFI